jgi:hypothetical protein
MTDFSYVFPVSPSVFVIPIKVGIQEVINRGLNMATLEYQPICTAIANWFSANWIALVALFLAGINTWFNFFRGPKIDVYVGGTIDLICTPEPQGSISGFHLHCTFINPSPKTAVITKISLNTKVYIPGVNQIDFEGRIEPAFFVKYSGDLSAHRDGPAHSLMVEKTGSVFQSIQFDIPNNYQNQEYSFGINYRTIDFDLSVWINEKSESETSKKFRTIIIDGGLPTPGSIEQVRKASDQAKTENRPKLCKVPISLR